MKYYLLQQKLNELTGSPQISGFTEKQDLLSDKSIYAFERLDFPEIAEVKYMLLDKSAKIEDVMCAEMLRLTGLLVNDKVKSILTGFNLPPNKFYPCYIKANDGNVYNYYWMQTSKERDQTKFLEYSRSKFYIQKDVLGLEKEELKIDTLQQLEKVSSSLKLGQAVKLQKAVLKDNFLESNLDLFKISRFYNYWIISERMKKSFESMNVTGM